MSNQKDAENIAKDAENFYKSLCEKEGILEVSASDDVAPGVKLKHLIDSQGWLPFIMIRTDEICKMLTGQRMWCAYYISDPMALRGLSVSDYESLSDESKSSVDKEDCPKTEIPHAARSLIALNGLRSAITFRNDQCYLNNLPKAYFINGLISEGQCIPALPIELFFSMKINQHIIETVPALNQIIDYPAADPEVSR